MVGWSGTAAAYDASFGRLCAGAVPATVEAALGGVGDVPRLLDVGCGTGAVARGALERAAAVHAVDASETMISFAGAVVPRARLGVAALPQLPYADGTFDAVTAGFVINHVADPRAAVAELRRVTRPGGRVVVTIWPAGPTAVTALWQQVIAAAGVVAPPAARLVPALDFDRTGNGLTGLLLGAGFGDVTARSLTWRLRVDVDAWWSGVEAGIATIGATHLAQSAAGRDRLRRAYADQVVAHVRDGALELPATALLAVGRA